MSRLTVRLMGTPQIEVDGVPIKVDTRKAIALLAYLVIEDQPQRRSSLAVLFWPELNQSKARGALRRTLSSLNRALGQGWLESDRQTIRLIGSDDLWLDVAHFHHLWLICQTDAKRHGSGGSNSLHIRRLREAIDLYRGDFLAGFSLRDSPEFDSWQLLQSEYLRQQVIGAFERLVCAVAAEGGELEEALDVARRWLALDPLNEHAHRQLMLLYTWNGRRNAALRQYTDCMALLDADLGVLPDSETRSLYQRILSGEEESWQLNSLEQSMSQNRHNLPAFLTPFVGREEELATITSLLLDKPDCRLLTLLGLGGIGKTRLALQAAWLQLAAFPDGVFWVELVGTDSTEALVSKVAEALTLSFKKGREPQEQLLEHLRDQEMLLVLDNFEQLLPEATALLTAILRQTTELKLLVTSRQRLAVRGEWLQEVTSLPVPTPSQEELSDEALESYSAVQLFVQEAQRLRLDFSLNAANRTDLLRILRVLAGVPLAIELAAVWIRLLSCAQIADELERTLDFLENSDARMPERHRSMRIVFEHTWTRLTEREQDVLRRLAVFAGDFSYHAALEIALATSSLLLALMDKSLLRRHASGRLEIHQIIRQYAAEKLACHEREARQEHASYYLRLAEEAEPELRGAQVGQWLDKLAAEHDNLRAALSWFISNAPEMAQELAAAISRFWEIRGLLHEGQHWLRQALLAQTENKPISRAKALNAVGHLTILQGDYAQATLFLQEALALWRSQEEPTGLATCLHRLGTLALHQGQWHPATASYQESVALRRTLGDWKGVASLLNNMGTIAALQRDYVQAASFYEEGLALRRQVADRWGVASCLNNLAELMSDLEDYERSASYWRECLAMYQEFKDQLGMITCISGLGVITIEQGQAKRAAQIYGACESLREQLNTPIPLAMQGEYEEMMARIRTPLNDNDFEAAWAQGRAMTLEEAIAYAVE